MAEGLRMKKKLESDVSELDTALEHANAANQDTQKAIKKYHQQIREAQAKLEDEQRNKEVVRDNLLSNERKANAGAKRKLESEMQTLHGDLDEMVSEASLSEEK